MISRAIREGWAFPRYDPDTNRPSQGWHLRPSPAGRPTLRSAPPDPPLGYPDPDGCSATVPRRARAVPTPGPSAASGRSRKSLGPGLAAGSRVPQRLTFGRGRLGLPCDRNSGNGSRGLRCGRLESSDTCNGDPRQGWHSSGPAHWPGPFGAPAKPPLRNPPRRRPRPALSAHQSAGTDSAAHSRGRPEASARLRPRRPHHRERRSTRHTESSPRQRCTLSATTPASRRSTQPTTS